ncbi:hypothetical protein CHL76_08695 [Marinococcus halophilus]|uniref:Uncharacterized protein n=1 Tax=Marinococcus halophilus TaxID=1371 RepID=A0A510Y4F6_MARHA|nr:hypothetical protein CHL76_08695 [Marinococcus halophilus]GEK58226.1 hypothetical protein MHA01_11310 [Marinococcus halophilus]
MRIFRLLHQIFGALVLVLMIMQLMQLFVMPTWLFLILIALLIGSTMFVYLDEQKKRKEEPYF